MRYWLAYQYLSASPHFGPSDTLDRAQNCAQKRAASALTFAAAPPDWSLATAALAARAGGKGGAPLVVTEVRTVVTIVTVSPAEMLNCSDAPVTPFTPANAPAVFADADVDAWLRLLPSDSSLLTIIAVTG